MMVPLDGVGPAGLSTRNSLYELNAQQQEAVVHAVQLPRSSPLLVIAGAGSGKTKTLAHRVAQLILSGADPARIFIPSPIACFGCTALPWVFPPSSPFSIARMPRTYWTWFEHV